ncbi:protein phosphatase PTC7, partial [Tremellales sp. Uapishka_1]
MVRPTARLLQTLHTPPIAHTPQGSSLIYSLGLSYASKSSPPFIPPQTKVPAYGFQGQKNKVGKWVDAMLSLRAGRGELRGGVEGGWDAKLGEETRKWGAGEDFFAIADGSGSTHLALSDGVGGWSPQYDPSLFSQSLMHHYALLATSSPSSAPWDCLTKGYAGTLADPGVEAGSGTAIGVVLGEGGKGKAVNLGDSGFSILRDDKIIFASTSQTHYFNCPRQLAKIPAKMKSQGNITDLPSDGERFDFEVIPGDVVILYTDGLSDNLPPTHLPLLSSTLTKLLASAENSHLSHTEIAVEKARLLADVLVGYGRMAMSRTGDEDGGKGWKTPFEIEARNNGYNFKGGKVDDITVMTAVVSERLM